MQLFCSNGRYNGFRSQNNKDGRKSKCELCKRSEANGVRPSKHHTVRSAETSREILDADAHSISFTMSRNNSVIVEYKKDDDTDMFQVFVHLVHYLYSIITLIELNAFWYFENVSSTNLTVYIFWSICIRLDGVQKHRSISLSWIH